MAILITGGAGYIGSHIAYEFTRHSKEVISIDHHPAGNRVPGVIYVCGDFADQNLLARIFAKYQCDTIVHCAAQIEVGASVTNPGLFYQENIAKTITLLNTARNYGVKNILFSSSCAVYGTPKNDTFTEDDPLHPISPYGETKRVIEQLLAYYAQAYDMRYLAFRYANAAGATVTDQIQIGERHEPETHLIPRILTAAYARQPITIFGDTYNTPDGTCIRDYVHVRDIARAHMLGLEYLRSGGNSGAYNLGSGIGSSVREVVDVIERIVDTPIARVTKEARPGDPARLVANIVRAQATLGWRPLIPLEAIVHDAYAWRLYTSKQISGQSDQTTYTLTMHT